MKTPTDIRLDQLRQELNAVKRERDALQLRAKKMQQGIVDIVDGIADYLGRSHPASRKILAEVEELR